MILELRELSFNSHLSKTDLDRIFFENWKVPLNGTWHWSSFGIKAVFAILKTELPFDAFLIRELLWRGFFDGVLIQELRHQYLTIFCTRNLSPSNKIEMPF